MLQLALGTVKVGITVLKMLVKYMVLLLTGSCLR